MVPGSPLQSPRETIFASVFLFIFSTIGNRTQVLTHAGHGEQRGLKSTQDNGRGIVCYNATRKVHPEEVEEREDRAEHTVHLKVQQEAEQPMPRPLRQDRAGLVKATACLLPRIPQENKNLLGIKLVFV